jgi:hypothetical protein
MPDAVVIRQPAALRVYLCGFGLVWFGFLVAIGIRRGGASALVAGFMLLLGGTLFYRMLRLSVVADEAGLLVHNNSRTKRYPWTEVEDFRVGAPGMAMAIGKTVHVLLRDGTIVTLDVTTRPWFSKRAKAKLETYLAGLRAWLPSPTK